MQKLLSVLWITLCLTACGGGGGGGGGSSSSASNNNAAPSPALTFSPASITQTVTEGTTSTINVTATVNTPSNFSGASTIYTYIVDSMGVLLPNPQIIQNSQTQFSVVLQTAATLTPGSHQGNFTVELCKDSQCASQFPGSPMQLPYTIQVTPAASPFIASAAMPANASSYMGGAAPAPVTINVTTTGLNWSATSNVNWAVLTPSSGSGTGSFVLNYNPSNLQAGQYNGIVTVTASDGQVSTVPVALTVLGNAFITSSSSVYFNAIKGAPVPTQNISLSLNSGTVGSWTASTDSNAAWLSVSPLAGSTPGLATFGIDTSFDSNSILFMNGGTYNTSAQFNSPGNAPSVIPVQLQLAEPTVALSSSVTIGGTYGRDFTTQVPLALSINTLTNAWPWTLSPLPSWISATPPSGTVSQAGTSVNFAANATSAPTGTTTAIMNAYVSVNGDVRSAPFALTVNKDQHKILASQTGVALASTPTWSRLTKTLTISDNYGQTANWSATSNQSWLNISQSGNTLTLSVNPTNPQFTLDSFSQATVTLSSTDASVSAPETIKVDFWNGSTTPTTMTQLAQPYTNIIADPIRPYVYVNSGSTFIDAYNIYTGQFIKRMNGLGGTLGSMTVSQNGDHLYVTDATSSIVEVFDLNNQAVLPEGQSAINLKTQVSYVPWKLTASPNASTRLISIRPNGVEIILVSDGSSFIAQTGQPITATHIASGDMTATADGKRVFVQDEGSSPVGVVAYSVDYSEMGGGTLFIAGLGSGGSGGSNGQDIAVSADGSHLYTASGSPYQCNSISPVNLRLIGPLSGGSAYPSSVKVGSDGKIYCGSSNGNSTADIWVSRADGTLQTSFKVSGAPGSASLLLPRQIAVSGDGFMLAALSSNPFLSFIPVGP